MRAIVVRELGGPEVLTIGERDDPQPKPGEIVVKVAAAGVNYMDIYQRSGIGNYKTPTPYTPGGEGAGTVLAVGEGVTEFAAGDLGLDAGHVHPAQPVPQRLGQKFLLGDNRAGLEAVAEGVIDRVGDGAARAGQLAQQRVAVEQAERARHLVLLLEHEPVEASPGDLVEHVARVQDLLVGGPHLRPGRGRDPRRRDRLDGVHVPLPAARLLQIRLEQVRELAVEPELPHAAASIVAVTTTASTRRRGRGLIIEGHVRRSSTCRQRVARKAVFPKPSGP